MAAKPRNSATKRAGGSPTAAGVPSRDDGVTIVIGGIHVKLQEPAVKPSIERQAQIRAAIAKAVAV